MGCSACPKRPAARGVTQDDHGIKSECLRSQARTACRLACGHPDRAVYAVKALARRKGQAFGLTGPQGPLDWAPFGARAPVPHHGQPEDLGMRRGSHRMWPPVSIRGFLLVGRAMEACAPAPHAHFNILAWGFWRAPRGEPPR